MKYSIGYQLPDEFDTTLDICKDFDEHISDVFFSFGNEPNGRSPLGREDEKEIIEKFVVPKKLKSEMYDKVNYMCRRYMDRIARFELDYDFVPDIAALKYALICIISASTSPVGMN